MKTLVTISCIFLISTSVFGQFDFTIDRSFSKKVDFIPDAIKEESNVQKPYFVDSVFQLEENYDFQLRFWHTGMTIPSTSVFMLTLRNKKWAARYFMPNKNWQSDGRQLAEIVVNQLKLEQLWELLVINDVLSLPSDQNITTPMIKYEIDTTNLGHGAGGGGRLDINDGILYEFQILKPNSSRYYSYHCPQTYLKHYSNIVEFYKASVIILLINKYLGLHEEIC